MLAGARKGGASPVRAAPSIWSLGIAYGFEGLRRLVSLVGPAHARMILYTGARIGADEALRIGLANRVVPPDGLEEVYRLHERARGGLKRLDPRAAAARLAGEGLAAHDHGHAEPAPAPEAEAPRRRTQRRAEQVQNAAG